MTRVYLADAQPEERSALRLLLADLDMEVVGEATDWSTTLARAPATRLDMLLVDWGLLPIEASAALSELRLACPTAIVIVLMSITDSLRGAALSAGANALISRGEPPEQVARHLRVAALNVSIVVPPANSQD